MFIKNISLSELQREKQKRKRKLLFRIGLIGLIISSLGVGGYYLGYVRSDSNGSEGAEDGKQEVGELTENNEADNNANSQDESQESTNTYTVEKQTYYVLVTSPRNNKLNYNIEELKNATNIYYVADSIEDEALGYEEKSRKQGENTVTDIEYLGELTNLEPTSSVEELKALTKEEKTTLGVINFTSLDYEFKVLDVEEKYLFDKTLDLETYPLVFTEEVESETNEPITNFSTADHTKIGHTGSMISPRGVQYHIETQRDGDYTHIFQPTKPLLDSMDYVSSTFESSILGAGRPCDTCTTFIGPDKFIEGVEFSGIDLFSLAANHIMDGGTEALQNTMNKLDDIEVPYLGASVKNNDDAGKPYLAEVNGLKIAYLAFNDTPGYAQWALENRPGAASISDVEVVNGIVNSYEPNEERIKYFVDRAEELNPDMIIAIMHWGGQEYVNQALPYQETLAELLVENGVDLILGDHVHWVQEIQYLDNAPVFYGVGNYIFDQMWSIETRQGITIELNFHGTELVNYRLHPHQLYLYTEGVVKPLTPDMPEYNQTLDRIWEVSSV